MPSHAEPYQFPDPVGPRRVRFRTDDLEWVEEELEVELDKLNDRIESGRGPVDPETGDRIEYPFESVWDALEEILNRRLFRGMKILVIAGIAHAYDGDPDTQRDRAAAEAADLSPAIYNDEGLAYAINVALGEALGVKPSTGKGDDDEAAQDGADLPPPPPEVAVG